jgi:hypothetical protein
MYDDLSRKEGLPGVDSNVSAWLRSSAAAIHTAVSKKNVKRSAGSDGGPLDVRDESMLREGRGLVPVTRTISEGADGYTVEAEVVFTSPRGSHVNSQVWTHAHERGSEKGGPGRERGRVSCLLFLCAQPGSWSGPRSPWGGNDRACEPGNAFETAESGKQFLLLARSETLR